MLGTINGAYLNLYAINVQGQPPARVADAAVIQANATSASAGVIAIGSLAALTQAAHTLNAAAANAIVAASALAQAAHALSAAATAAVGSTLSATNDTQGISGASTGAIAAQLEALSHGDALEATAEAEAIKAVLNFIQQAQTLSASGSVLGGVSLNALLADQVGAGSGTLAIAGAGVIQGLDDLLTSAFKQILNRKAFGADVLPHANGNTLTPHGLGNSVTVH